MLTTEKLPTRAQTYSKNRNLHNKISCMCFVTLESLAEHAGNSYMCLGALDFLAEYFCYAGNFSTRAQSTLQNILHISCSK